MTKEQAIRKLMADTKLDREEIERNIDILCYANRTPDEACRYIKMGTVIYEVEDLKSFWRDIFADMSEDDAEEFLRMVNGGDCMVDWERVTYNGVKYLIQFVY